MQLIFHVIMMLFAAFRLVDLMVGDKIFDPIRIAFPNIPFKCVRCNSVWSGAIVTLFYYFIPWLNWPLAISWLYMAYGDYLSTKIKDK